MKPSRSKTLEKKVEANMKLEKLIEAADLYLPGSIASEVAKKNLSDYLVNNAEAINDLVEAATKVDKDLYGELNYESINEQHEALQRIEVE